MFLAKVFVVFTCVTLSNYVYAQREEEEESGSEELDDKQEVEEETSPPPPDNHTFVALIDIVFTDGSKRTCTGTIIHDNVVITAAHCFSDHTAFAQAELTASFVVIGTQRMFETGYENYLPIERVITHPKFRGWTADVALVFTFAGMTSDKPGNVIALVGENSMTPVDSNVTVLSWGHCKDEMLQTHTRGPVVAPSPDHIGDSSEDDSCEQTKNQDMSQEGYNSRQTSANQESEDISNTAERNSNWQRKNNQPADVPNAPEELAEIFPHQYGRQGGVSSMFTKIRSRLATVQLSYDKRPVKGQKYSKYIISRERSPNRVTRSTTTKIPNRYLTYSDENMDRNRENVRKPPPAKQRYHKPQRNVSDSEDRSIMIMNIDRKRENFREPPPARHRYHKAQRNVSNSEDQSIMVMMDADQVNLKLFVDPTHRASQTSQTRGRYRLMVNQGRERKYHVSDERKKGTKDVKEQTKSSHNKIESNYKNWRRQMGPKENHLTVETFGFVNVQTCKKLVDRALPAVYSINPNHVVCYASEDHYINGEDSGAPAIRQGQLVAVTLGGVECEGDHVAIGIKMSCLCSWIADNLPNDSGKDWKCCKNCCDGSDATRTHKQRNKYLYNY